MTHAYKPNAPFHLVIWLDHRQARIFEITGKDAYERSVHSHDSGLGHIHHHSGTTGAGHLAMDKSFMEEVAGAMGEAEEILLVGPGEAKKGFQTFLQKHRPLQAARVMGVIPMEQSSAGEIAAAARQFFSAADKMKPAAAGDWK
jgi:stalled ribosome rescue protein Dom34